MSRDVFSTSNDPSSSCTRTKKIVKKTTCFLESITASSAGTTTRQQHTVMFQEDKENCFAKESEVSTTVVKQLKVYYEEFADGRTTRVRANGAQGTTVTDAAKKRKLSESASDHERDKSDVAKKRVSFCEEDAFVKSRFKIYIDNAGRKIGKESAIDKAAGKSAKKTDNAVAKKWEPCPRCPIADKRLNKIKLREIGETLPARVTPIDVQPVPPTIKKVKVLHRNRLSKDSATQTSTNDCVSRNADYELPYDDNFIEYEMEKEMAVPHLSENLRRQNITVEQRQIIIKFLTRLQTHLFLPSFLLYQTVKLFDNVLNAKVVEIKDLQLVALASMWIVLKKEHLAYNIPTAEKMISFAKDLYEGKVDLLLKCEIDVLQTLNFNIAFSDPFSIMCYDITKCYRSEFMTSNDVYRTYCCGSYMIDLSLFDEDLTQIPVVLLAAAAAETALYFSMEEVDDKVEPLWSTWRAPHTAQSYSDEEISAVRKKLLRKVVESQQRHSYVEIVFKKYVRSRYGRISHFLGRKVVSYLREE